MVKPHSYPLYSTYSQPFPPLIVFFILFHHQEVFSGLLVCVTTLSQQEAARRSGHPLTSTSGGANAQKAMSQIEMDAIRKQQEEEARQQSAEQKAEQAKYQRTVAQQAASLAHVVTAAGGGSPVLANANALMCFVDLLACSLFAQTSNHPIIPTNRYPLPNPFTSQSSLDILTSHLRHILGRIGGRWIGISPQCLQEQVLCVGADPRPHHRRYAYGGWGCSPGLCAALSGRVHDSNVGFVFRYYHPCDECYTRGKGEGRHG